MAQNKFPLKDLALIVLCTFLFTSGFMILKETFVREKAPIHPVVQNILLPPPAAPVSKKPLIEDYEDAIDKEKPDRQDAREIVRVKDITAMPRNTKPENLDQLIMETLQMDAPKSSQETTPPAENPEDEIGIL